MYFVVVMNPELGLWVVVVEAEIIMLELVKTALTSMLIDVVLLQSAQVYADDVLVVVVVVVFVVFAASTWIELVEVLVQSAQAYSLEVLVVLVLLELVFTSFTGRAVVVVLIHSAQSAQVAESGMPVVVEEVVDVSIAWTGIVGLGGLCSLGVSVTVIVLCMTSVTVTYEMEHGAPVYTGTSVIVSVVVDCRVMVVVGSMLAAATLLRLPGPFGIPGVGDGRVMVA